MYSNGNDFPDRTVLLLSPAAKTILPSDCFLDLAASLALAPPRAKALPLGLVRKSESGT